MSFRYSLWNKYLISRELTKGKNVPYDKILKQIVKTSDFFSKKMQIRTIQKIYKMTRQPLPLKYKVKEYDFIDIYRQAQVPLNPINLLPFNIFRTHTNSLPVYSEYKQKHMIKRTIIRNVRGDVEKLVNELYKVTSNSNIKVKTGKIEVDGLHVEKIKNYLARLGF